MTDTVTTKRIVRYDPTSHQAYCACPRKFWLENQKGYVAKLGNKYLDFGSAFHKARELMRRGTELPVALNIALTMYAECNCSKMPPRSLQDLKLAIELWHRAYGEGRDLIQPLQLKDGDPCVEKPFKLPLWSTAGTDVLLCGKIDEIAIDPDKARLLIVDCKTTSSTKVQEYQNSYDCSPQMHIYSYAVRQTAGLDYYPDVLIDGLFLSKNGGPSVYRAPSPVKIYEYQVERIMSRVLECAKEIARKLDAGEEFRHEFNSCAGKFDECPFFGACRQIGMAETMIINTLFKQRVYDPETF